MTLGNRIYKYRTEHGLSRESIAEKCSVSSRSIQKWESGNSKPSLENLIMLSKIFSHRDEYAYGCRMQKL